MTEGSVDKVEVQLTADLSAYHRDLVPGAIGKTVPPIGVKSAGAKFCSVAFPGVVAEVQWRHLKIVDEAFLKTKELQMKQISDSIASKTATAKLTVGKKGGFRMLLICYKINDATALYATADPKERDRLMEILTAAGIEVVKEVKT